MTTKDVQYFNPVIWMYETAYTFAVPYSVIAAYVWLII